MRTLVLILTFIISLHHIACADEYYFMSFKNEKGTDLGTGYIKYFQLQSKAGHGLKFYFKVRLNGSKTEQVGFEKVDSNWNLQSFQRDTYVNGSNTEKVTGSITGDFFILKRSKREDIKFKTPATPSLFLAQKYNSTNLKKINVFFENNGLIEMIDISKQDLANGDIKLSLNAKIDTQNFIFKKNSTLVKLVIITKDGSRLIGTFEKYDEKLHPKNSMQSFFSSQN